MADGIISNRKIHGGMRTFNLDSTTELLQYFTSTGVTFAADDDSLAATSIGTGFTAGDYISISGSGEAANNTVRTIETVAAGKLTVSGDITDDTPGETVKVNQVYIGNWHPIDQFSKLVGVINATGSCTGYIDQSNDGVTVHYSTTESVTGGTPLGYAVETVALYGRLRIVNGDADQTTFTAFMNGRTLS